MGVETGLVVAVSIVVVAAFAAPWLWPAMDNAAKRPPRGRDSVPPAPPEPHPDSAPYEIDRDEVVVRLRDRGLTYRRIAERLSDDFGQHMSESTARRIWLRAHGEGRSRREDEGDRRREASFRSHGGRRSSMV